MDYTEDSLNVLTIGDSSSLSNDGGDEVSDVVITKGKSSTPSPSPQPEPVDDSSEPLPLVCPNNWIKVPEDLSSEVNTTEFCVMQYEAKKVSGVATSQSSGLPWTSVIRGITAATVNSALKACKDLGDEFDLISNAQWQAIARNIETAQNPVGTYLNWSNSSISGSNAINRGHTDNAPANALDAGTDANPCVGTGNLSCADHSQIHFNQKRTHTLSNGEVIWDLSGNVFEWVKDDSNFAYEDFENCSNDHWSVKSASSGNICQSPDCNGPQGGPKSAFGPLGEYPGKNSGEYGGLGTLCRANYEVGAILRGAHFMTDTRAGIFYASFDRPVNYSDSSIGFRCVKNKLP